MKTALFIDRDGTILCEPEDEQIDSFEKFRFVDGAISNLAFLRTRTQHEFVMVSNQDGLGTDAYPEEDFWPTHNLMLQTLKGEGVEFDDILIDRSFPEDHLPTRKPGTGMMSKYLSGDYDLSRCYVIGDRDTDAQLAINLGCKAVVIAGGLPDAQRDALKEKYAFSDQIFVSDTWNKVAEIIFGGQRVASVRRTTKETDVDIRLDLDGQGQCDISTGLGFFDHMLEQIAKHGNVGLRVHVKGDLHVDEHHTIEDGHRPWRVLPPGIGRQTWHRALWLLPAHGRLPLSGGDRLRRKGLARLGRPVQARKGGGYAYRDVPALLQELQRRRQDEPQHQSRGRQ